MFGRKSLVFFCNLHWNDLVTLRLTREYQLMYKFTFHAEKCNSLGITVIVIKSSVYIK